MMKKVLSTLLCAALLTASLAGCGGKGSSSSAASSGGSSAGTSGERSILYHAFDSQPYVTLDPSTEQSNGVSILQNCYETLTRYDYKTGEVKPLLAESWSSNEDGTEWKFQIKQGVKFHDGADMDAAAVAASIQRTIDLNMGAAFIWAAVDSVEATGDYEVTFKLSEPAALDLIASAAYAAYIISPNAIDKTTEWFNEGNNAGTGPYKIQKASGNEEVILERFDDYWGGWSDNQFTNVIVKQVGESSARRQLLETGEAHLAYNFSSTDLKALREETDKVKVLDMPTYNNVMICLNTEKPPLDNVDFRRAMAYAFPYKETVDNVLEGNGKQCYGMVPSGLWAHSEELFQYSTDLEKAQEYIDKSGISTDGMKLELTIKSGDDAYRNLAQLYQVNLKKLGIELEIRELNWDAQWEKGKNPNPADRQDMLLFIWWPDYASPTSWFNTLVKSEDTIQFNLAYIKDGEFDQMIAEADSLTVTDRAAAEQKFIDIQKRLVDECQYIYLYDQMHIYVTSPAITGVEENPAYPTAVQYYKITKAS
jgi:peptide/nickel transport system substrate-binding protein